MPPEGIQEAESGEPVEPGVGDAIDKGGTIPLRLLAERGDLAGNLP
jgi:hypothetical protein